MISSNILQRTHALLTENHIHTYMRKGVVCIRQSMTEDELEKLKFGIEFNLQTLSSRVNVVSRPDIPVC